GEPVDVVAFEYGSYAQFAGGAGRWGGHQAASEASTEMGRQLLLIAGLAGVGDGCPARTEGAGGGAGDPVREAIVRAYRELLGRDPDPFGMANYTLRMSEGTTEAGMRAHIMASKGYADRHGLPWPPVSGSFDRILDTPLTP